MKIVWGRGEATVADVWKELSAKRHVARNTVQTMMKRLEDKRYLRHELEGNGFLYSATVGRSSTLREMVCSFVESAFSGSAEGLVMALIDGRGLSKDEAQRIRALIDSAAREKRR